MNFRQLSVRCSCLFQLIILLASVSRSCATTKRALFLGNSYTYVNNLPQMIADAAASAGDTLFVESNTPGGQSLGGHLADPVSVNKIKEGGFDFVVLQEQSMRPSEPDDWIEADFLVYAHRLDSIINLYNPCGETMFYMTWGYRDGNPQYCDAYPWWPYECTYQVMDSLTNLRYRMAADSNHAVISPVGAVWHYIRDHFPSIELYDSDGSHPSLAGSYAGACCFYSSIFRKSPYVISYTASLDAATVSAIHQAVKAIVYDSLLTWHIGEYDGQMHDSCGTYAGTSKLMIFPNPANDGFTVRLPDGLANADLSVYNSTGSLVHKFENVSGDYLRIPADKLSCGIYFMRLTNEGKTLSTGKAIVP